MDSIIWPRLCFASPTCWLTCWVTADALWQCPALLRVVECTCSVEAEVSSNDAACSLAPWARDWLLASSWWAASVTWPLMAAISPANCRKTRFTPRTIQYTPPPRQEAYRDENVHDHAAAGNARVGLPAGRRQEFLLLDRELFGGFVHTLDQGIDPVQHDLVRRGVIARGRELQVLAIKRQPFRDSGLPRMRGLPLAIACNQRTQLRDLRAQPGGHGFELLSLRFHCVRSVATAAGGFRAPLAGVQPPDDRVGQRDLQFGGVDAHLLETGLQVSDQAQLFRRAVDGYVQGATQPSDGGKGGVAQCHHQRQHHGEGQQQFCTDLLDRLHSSSPISAGWRRSFEGGGMHSTDMCRVWVE